MVLIGPVMQHILMIEDDRHLGPSVKKGLDELGFCVSLAPSGRAAQAALKGDVPDLIVLDLGLPDCDGVNLLQTIRDQGYECPVLILTARDALDDKLDGFGAGADDYLVKPFAFAELLVRIRALLRRASNTGQMLRIGDIEIDLLTRHVERGGEAIDLTPREFDLLAYLAQHAGHVVSREMLTENVWRETSRFTPLDNVIDVHVSRLRRKLFVDSEFCELQVIRGIGFRLVEPL